MLPQMHNGNYNTMKPQTSPKISNGVQFSNNFRQNQTTEGQYTNSDKPPAINTQNSQNKSAPSAVPNGVAPSVVQKVQPSPQKESGIESISKSKQASSLTNQSLGNTSFTQQPLLDRPISSSAVPMKLSHVQLPNFEQTKYSIKENGVVKAYAANTN